MSALSRLASLLWRRNLCGPIRALTASTDGASAVEFALVSPLLITILLGIVTFGMLFGTLHGLQELTSQAARASISGLTDVERDSIARSFIKANATQYAFIDDKVLSISTGWADGRHDVYAVTTTYDLSASLIYAFKGWVPLPNPNVTFTSAIQRGGY